MVFDDHFGVAYAVVGGAPGGGASAAGCSAHLEKAFGCLVEGDVAGEAMDVLFRGVSGDSESSEVRHALHAANRSMWASTTSIVWPHIRPGLLLHSPVCYASGMMEAMRLGLMTTSIRQGTNLRRSQAEAGDRLPMIQVRDVEPEGIATDLDSGTFDSERIVVATKGHVLLTQSAHNLRAAVVEGDEHYVVGPNIACIEVKPTKLNPYYLAGLLNTEATRNRLQRLAKGGASMMIPLGELKRFEVPIVPLGQQELYANVFRAAMETKRAARDLCRAQDNRIEHYSVSLWEATGARS